MLASRFAIMPRIRYMIRLVCGERLVFVAMCGLNHCWRRTGHFWQIGVWESRVEKQTGHPGNYQDRNEQQATVGVGKYLISARGYVLEFIPVIY